MNCWDSLCSNLSSLRTLRDGMHRMLIRIGIECLTSQHKQVQPQQPASKPTQAAPIMQQWSLPQELPIASKPYIIPKTSALIQWISDLHDSTFPVQRWSWWQLFLDAWMQIPMMGPWYHVNQKQWKGGSTQPHETFQRKARWFAQYVTKLSKSCDVPLPLQHMMPSGSIITFWTKTLTVRVPSHRTDALDSWFGRHITCATKTADFKRINL